MDGLDHRHEHPEEVTLLDYVVGHLDADSSDEIRRHVTTCEACRTRIMDISSAMDELDRLPTASIPHDALGAPRATGRGRRSNRAVPLIALLVAVAGILLLFEVGGFRAQPDPAADRRVVIRTATDDVPELVGGLLAGIPHRIVENRGDDRHLVVLVPDAQVRPAAARLAPAGDGEGKSYVVDIAGTGTTLAGETGP